MSRSWAFAVEADRPRRAGVQRHLVDFLDMAIQTHLAGRRIIDLDDASQELERPVVAAGGGQLHGAAELERRLRLVAGAAGLEALLNDLGQLRLTGVVRDLATDARGQRDLVSPDGTDERLRDRLAVDDEAYARG